MKEPHYDCKLLLLRSHNVLKLPYLRMYYNKLLAIKSRMFCNKVLAIKSFIMLLRYPFHPFTTFFGSMSFSRKPFGRQT